MIDWFRAHGHYGGWVALVAVIIATDTVGDRTMSAAFRDVSRHRVGRPVLIAGWILVTGHLFGVIPAEYDILMRIPALRWAREVVVCGDTN